MLSEKLLKLKLLFKKKSTLTLINLIKMKLINLSKLMRIISSNSYYKILNLKSSKINKTRVKMMEPIYQVGKMNKKMTII